MIAVAITNSPNTHLVLDTALPHDAEIDEARALLAARKPSEARAFLERKKRRHWDEMTPRQKYRVAANIGVACMLLGENSEASEAFLLAGRQLPDDDEAQAFHAWGLELRGKKTEAFEIAKPLVQRRNKRAAGVYLRCAPIDASVVELEHECGDLKDEYDTTIALCVRAVNTRVFGKALEYAGQLTSKHPESPDGFLLLGQALMHEQLAKFRDSDVSQNNTLNKQRLAQADEALTRAIDLGTALGSLPPINETVGAALFVRHQVRYMLDQRQASDADLEDAWRLQPDDPNVLVSKAVAIRNHSEQLALKYLERAAHVTTDERVHFLCGEAQIACGNIEGGVSKLLLLASAKGAFSTEAIATVIETRVTQQRLDDAEKLLKESEIPDGSRRTLAARIEIARSNRDAAATNALEAHRALGPGDPPDVRRLLAHMLHNLGFNEQAFSVWDSFVVHGIDSQDFKNYLLSAYHTGKHDLVLKACSKFEEQGISSRFYVSLECHILQVYDPERAFLRLAQAIARFPNDTEFNFLYACVALRTGRKAEAAEALAPERIPSPASTSLTVAPMITRALVEIGRSDDAVSFAHSFLRKHWSEEGAHHLYVVTLVGAPEARAEQPSSAGVNTAICYKDQEGQQSWVVIEADGDDAQLALNETTLSSSLGSAFAGKSVGAKFELSSGVEPRTVEIIALQNKYSYRLNDVMDHFRDRFPSSNIVQSFRVPDDPIELVSVGSPLFRIAAQRRDYTQSLTSTYEDGALTLCCLAKALGADPISCQLDLISCSQRIRAGVPDQQLLQLALTALSTRSELFLDTSAMATFILLDLATDVAMWPWRLVTTSSCLDILRSFTKDMRDKRERGGLGLSGGQVIITPHDTTVPCQFAERAERLASALKIIDARPLAAVPPIRRDQLEQLFGRWGAEAIACSAQPDRVLWTDDMLLAAMSARLDVLPASTQTVTAAAVARRHTSTTRELEISTELLLHGYEPLNIPDELIRHIASSSKWKIIDTPLSKLVERLKNAIAPAWLRIARIIIAEEMLNLELPESRSAAVVTVLETLRTRDDNSALLRTLLRSMRGFFSLNMMREAEFFQIADAWARSSWS